ncbi:MAG: hypothetical protein JJU05_08725 [Verrucomicrobia bacterium]|nr:hypothetical protein [Verrucomicrobiota bacterium]MCH8527838.1 hypothetical protein [Kiritimatiellia bacterium]
MKTTIELPDDLLLEAKQAALHRRTTLRALMMSGLRRELGISASHSPHALLEIASVGEKDWQSIDADDYLNRERNAWE